MPGLSEEKAAENFLTPDQEEMSKQRERDNPILGAKESLAGSVASMKKDLAVAYERNSKYFYNNLEVVRRSLGKLKRLDVEEAERAKAEILEILSPYPEFRLFFDEGEVNHPTKPQRAEPK